MKALHAARLFYLKNSVWTVHIILPNWTPGLSYHLFKPCRAIPETDVLQGRIVEPQRPSVAFRLLCGRLLFLELNSYD